MFDLEIYAKQYSQINILKKILFVTKIILIFD